MTAIFHGFFFHLLSPLERFLGHHLSVGVEAEILLHKAGLGKCLRSVPNLSKGSSLHLLSHPLRLSGLLGRLDCSLGSFGLPSCACFPGCSTGGSFSDTLCGFRFRSGTDCFDGHVVLGVCKVSQEVFSKLVESPYIHLKQHG